MLKTHYSGLFSPSCTIICVLGHFSGIELPHDGADYTCPIEFPHDGGDYTCPRDSACRQ